MSAKAAVCYWAGRRWEPSGQAQGYGSINASSKMDELESDYKAERISRSEYLARKSQLEKGSIIY